MHVWGLLLGCSVLQQWGLSREEKQEGWGGNFSTLWFVCGVKFALSWCPARDSSAVPAPAASPGQVWMLDTCAQHQHEVIFTLVASNSQISV